MEEIKLTVDKDVLDFMVKKAMEFALGARGLRSIFEAVMMDAMYDLPSEKDTKEFKLTLSYAKEKLKNSSIQNLKVA